MSRCPSDVSLEAVLFGDDDDGGFVESHLEECAGCRERLDALAGADTDFVAPTQEVRGGSESLQQVMADLKTAPLGRPAGPVRPLYAWLGLGVALLIGLLVWVNLPDGPSPTPAPPTASSAFFNPQSKTGHESLADAIENAGAGDVIEIHTGDVHLPDGLDLDRELTLRAGAGYEPTLQLGAPITHRAPLGLEGMVLQATTTITSHAPLTVCHCSLQRNGAGSENTPLITATGGAGISIINSALVSKRGIGLAVVGHGSLKIENTLVATGIGIAIAGTEAEIRLTKVSFHGTILARSRPPQRPTRFEVVRCAIDADSPSNVRWLGHDNLYQAGDPIPPGDDGAESVTMDFRKRIRRQVRTGGSEQGHNLRPSAEATERFPERGFDPELAGLGEAYQRFREADAYRDWRNRAESLDGE